MAPQRFESYDRNTDALEMLDPRVKHGRIKAIPKTRLVSQSALNGKTQAGLAKALGVAKSTITKWAKGQAHMSNRRVIEAAYMLDISPLWLLGFGQDSSFDWRGPSMQVEQYATVKESRRRLEQLVCTITDKGQYLEDYPADYRDVNQLLLDVIVFCARQHSGKGASATLIDILCSECGPEM